MALDASRLDAMRFWCVSEPLSPEVVTVPARRTRQMTSASCNPLVRTQPSLSSPSAHEASVDHCGKVSVWKGRQRQHRVL